MRGSQERTSDLISGGPVVKFAKTLISLAGATVLLGALIASASARNLSSSSQTLRATFSRIDFTGGFGTVECAVTVEGSFHSRTIQKNLGHLAGLITRAIVGTCPRGSATVLQESLPWHVRYNSFEGTLPNIRQINATISGLAFRMREPTFGLTCLAVSEEEEPATLTFNRDVVTRALTTALAGGTVTTDCGTSGTLRSTAGPLVILNSTSRITVTLI